MRKHLLGMLLFLTLACNFPVGGVASADPEPEDTPGSSPEVSSTPISDPGSSTPDTIVPIPASDIQIDGASYQAFRTPGDPFRFVCPSPCTIDPQLIYAQYAGFHNAHENLVRLTGVDPLPELQPVDIHTVDDPKCGKFSERRTLATAFAFIDDNFRATICTFLFEYAEGSGGGPYMPEDAVQLDRQGTLLHEFAHTLFYGRLPLEIRAIHDLVTPIGFYSWKARPGEKYLCNFRPQTPPGDFGGRLILELCEQNGFREEHLALIMTALDDLYYSGGGQMDYGYQYPSPSADQFRGIFNRILGSDTSQAFKDACWPASLFGEDYTLAPACTERTLEPTWTRLP